MVRRALDRRRPRPARSRDSRASRSRAGPGLIGSLLVGLSAAKALALAWGVPLVGVNHLEGHLFAPLLEHPDLEWPLMTLLVSGGHSLIVLQRGPGSTRCSARPSTTPPARRTTRSRGGSDSATPADPRSTAWPRRARAGSLKLPVSMTGDDFDLSFSGLKTAVVRATERTATSPLADVAASFQAAVAEQLLRKLRRALERYPTSRASRSPAASRRTRRCAPGVIELAEEFGVGAAPADAGDVHRQRRDDRRRRRVPALAATDRVPSICRPTPNWQLADVS